MGKQNLRVIYKRNQCSSWYCFSWCSGGLWCSRTDRSTMDLRQSKLKRLGSVQGILLPQFSQWWVKTRIAFTSSNYRSFKSSCCLWRAIACFYCFVNSHGIDCLSTSPVKKLNHVIYRLCILKCLISRVSNK